MKKAMMIGNMLAALTALADDVPPPGPDSNGVAVLVVTALAVSAGAALLVWLGCTRKRAGNDAAKTNA